MKNMLPQAFWPIPESGKGQPAVALGVDGLGRAKASKDEEAIRSVLLQQANGPLEDVRTDKIARLRAAIANGTYAVSAEELADKMIERMSEPLMPRVDPGEEKKRP